MSRLSDRVRRRRGNEESVPPQALPPASPPASPPSPAAPAESDLPGQFARLAGELEEADETRRRRALAAARRRVSKSGTVTWHGARSAGHWMADQVITMAPRIAVRDAATLRRQYPGKTPEEMADILIRGASRTAAGVGAAVGAASVLPMMPAMPVEVATETLALVAIELKLIAELHEVYGMRAPGSTIERMSAYVGSWARRSGVVGLAPGGIILAVGSPLRRRLQRRLLARAGRSATSLGPLLTGVAAGAWLNQHETRKLGQDIRDDLRHRSPLTGRWQC
jgi:hypothetical protein